MEVYNLPLEDIIDTVNINNLLNNNNSSNSNHKDYPKNNLQVLKASKTS